LGWPETTVVIRFWIVSFVLALVGLSTLKLQMIVSDAFRGKRYAVLGLARSGLATVRALVASGADVSAWDSKEEARDSALEEHRRSREAGSRLDGVAPLSESGPRLREGDGSLAIADPLRPSTWQALTASSSRPACRSTATRLQTRRTPRMCR
jgi:hypothetical protein